MRQHDRCPCMLLGAHNIVPQPITASLQQKLHICVSMVEFKVSRSSPPQLRQTYEMLNRSSIIDPYVTLAAGPPADCTHDFYPVWSE